MPVPDATDAVSFEQRSWTNTNSGIAFYPFRPTPEMINAQDIAHGLSNLCRYSGQCESFFSVGEHSVLVADAVKRLGGTREEQLWGLLHDAPEAYIIDLPRPIKRHPNMAFYGEVEDGVMRAICTHFGLPVKQPDVVTLADNQLIAIEAPALIPRMGGDWKLPVLDERLRGMTVQGLAPGASKALFLWRLSTLQPAARAA